MINDCNCGSEVNEVPLEGSKMSLEIKTSRSCVDFVVVCCFPNRFAIPTSIVAFVQIVKGALLTCWGGGGVAMCRCCSNVSALPGGLTSLLFFFSSTPVQWRQSSQVALSGSRSEGGGCHGSKGACSLSVYDATHTHPQAHKGKCVLEVFLTAGL